MDFLVDRVDVWAARITDDPGAMAGVLTALSKAGADLDFVIGRRSSEAPGEGVVFVTPLRAINSLQSSFLPIFCTKRLRISNFRLGVANPRTALPSCMIPIPTPSFVMTPDASSTLAACRSSSVSAML